jgi:hypothetical protein
MSDSSAKSAAVSSAKSSTGSSAAIAGSTAAAAVSSADSAPDPSIYSTPIEYARRIRVKADTVRFWCDSGELRAVDVAAKQSTRRRWKISPDAIVEFENGRGAQQPIPARRRRRKTPDNVTQYF